MSSLEIELQDLRERNNELVKKVQHWKMTAAQRENEKLDLMKENNDLRLKLSRLRSGGAAHARKLDANIQAATKEALTHLVQASNAVTKTIELVTTYMEERQEAEATLPRWSSMSNTPSSEKVHRVLPMLIGGQSIQPVVSLSRTLVNNIRTNRSPSNNHEHNFSERVPLPMHMLQDLYIPLTRIDANGLPISSMDVDPDSEDADANNTTEDLGLEDSGDQSIHESQNLSDTEQFDETRRLDVVEEDLEPEDEVPSAPKQSTENPMEGPSWMLDGPSKGRKAKSRMNLEPDSTTECEESRASIAPAASAAPPGSSASMECERLACEFSPTVRRRKRTSSPPAASPAVSPAPHAPPAPHAYSPRPAARRPSSNGRILKVLVSKLRMETDEAPAPKRPSLDNSPSRAGGPSGAARVSSPVASPPARRARDLPLLSFDAPSPNGATTSHVIISESPDPAESGGSGEPAGAARRMSKLDGRAGREVKQESRDSCNTTSQHDSRGSQDSDSGSDLATEGRTRRPRKAVTYKEKPLNRKMRR